MNETMRRIEDNAFTSSITVVIVFGIFGNILVILSILRQKKNMLKNNYYFLVLHLAICDPAALVIYIFSVNFWLKEQLSDHSPMITCNIYVITETFHLAGVGMMLVISLLRYRATVHPLKPSISQRKLKVVCGLVYLAGLILAYGTYLPLCSIKSKVVVDAYKKFYYAIWIFFFYLVPTIFMSVVYYKISRSLIKQNKCMKRICSNAIRRPAPDSSLNILRYIRNRRTFLVCLSTVLCYGISHIPISVWLMLFITDEYRLRMKYVWIKYFASVLAIAGSHSINPIIYGILDKKLLTFWKCCRKNKRRT